VKRARSAPSLRRRAGKKRRTQTIHAKIANSRKDFLHKETTKIADAFSLICVVQCIGPLAAGDERRAGIAAAISIGAKVKAVLEDGDQCILQFEDGSSVTVNLANPGASVAVRDRGNAVEYLG